MAIVDDTLRPGLPAASPPRWPVLAGGVASGLAGIAIASVGLKWQVALLAVFLLGGVLILARDRQTLFLAITVASMQVTLHKAFSQVLGDNSSGVVALYITTVNAAVALLYVSWLWTGGLFRALPRLLTHPIAICTYLAILGEALSIINAAERDRVLWGLFRDLWMLLLFWYAAAHLTTRHRSFYVLGGLYVIIAAQTALVVAQYVTHRPILAQLLAERQSSTLEIKDVVLANATAALFRPSGTAVHPDFLASFILPGVVVACALAITSTDRRLKLCSFGAFGLGLICLALTLARAALVGFGVAVLLTVALLILRHLVTRRQMQQAVIMGLVLLAIASVPIARKMITNFQAVGEELDARGELLHVSWNMFLAHPFVGVGASNFVDVMHNYSNTPLIFDGNPVHSLYMLELSETGLFGTAAWLSVYIAILYVGWKAMRNRDPLLAVIAVALTASVVGLYIEETITFSLREDAPLEMFWLVAGWLAGIAAATRGSPQPADGSPMPAPPTPALPIAERE